MLCLQQKRGAEAHTDYRIRSLQVRLSPTRMHVRNNIYGRSVFAGRPCKTLSARPCSPLCPCAASYGGYPPSSDPALMSKRVIPNLNCPSESGGGEGALTNTDAKVLTSVIPLQLVGVLPGLWDLLDLLILSHSQFEKYCPQNIPQSSS